MKVGILGVGHFGAYLTEGLFRAGSIPVVLSPRSAEKASALAKRFGCSVAASNQEVVDKSDIVLLAVRPKDAAETVTSLRWRNGQTLVSFCGGVSLSALKPGPATVVRAMGSAAVAQGESTIVFFPDVATVRPVLERLGPVLALDDEAALDVGTVMYGYYAMLFGIMAQGEEWAIARGLSPDHARTIVGWAFRGAGGALLRDRSMAVGDILASLATPGGLTERGLNSLNSENALEAWFRALDAVLVRTRGGS